MAIFILGCLSGTSYSQSGFGVELSFARLKTWNAGQLLGSSEGHYIIDAERDPIASSYSIGVSYQLSKHHLLKLSLGRHHNGRILDGKTYSDDFTSPIVFENLNARNQFFQINPSYAYRIFVKRLFSPIEVGLNINRRINIENIRHVGTRSLNYDLSISTGFGYLVTDFFSGSIKGVYNHALNEYQTMYEDGTFKPRQFGLEISLMYQFPHKEEVSE